MTAGPILAVSYDVTHPLTLCRAILAVPYDGQRLVCITAARTRHMAATSLSPYKKKTPAEGWAVAPKGETCDDFCKSRWGFVCDADRQTAIVSEDKVRDAASNAGVTCTKFESRDYSGVPFIGDPGECVWLKGGGTSDCSRVGYPSIHPLCYCKLGGICFFDGKDGPCKKKLQARAGRWSSPPMLLKNFCY